VPRDVSYLILLPTAASRPTPGLFNLNDLAAFNVLRLPGVLCCCVQMHLLMILRQQLNRLTNVQDATSETGTTPQPAQICHTRTTHRCRNRCRKPLRLRSEALRAEFIYLILRLIEPQVA
jgi:hypothetical protein